MSLSMATALIRKASRCSEAGRRALSAAVNYMKSGSPPGAADGDASTPAWTADLASPPPTAFELRRRAEKEGDALAIGEATKLFKLEARARIKARNALKAKK